MKWNFLMKRHMMAIFESCRTLIRRRNSWRSRFGLWCYLHKDGPVVVKDTDRRAFGGNKSVRW